MGRLIPERKNSLFIAGIHPDVAHHSTTEMMCHGGHEKAMPTLRAAPVSHQRRQPRDRFGFGTIHRVPQIPVALQAKPEIGGHTHHPSQAQSRIRRHR